MTVHFSLFLLSPTDGAATHTDNLEGDRTSTESSVEHKFDNPVYGTAEELESKTGLETSQERMCSNPLYESSNIRYPRTSPPDHLVKNGTMSHVTGPVDDSTSYRDESQPKEGTPVYDTADPAKTINKPKGLKPVTKHAADDVSQYNVTNQPGKIIYR